MSDQRMNSDLIHDVLDVLDRHGYTRADDEHAGRAVLLISDLAHIYEGAQDHPFGPYINGASPSNTEPAPAGPAARDASRQRRSRPSWPPWTSPPTTSATAPQPAPTVPASPVPHASRVSSTPAAMTA
jgi:hypothetical protein